MDPLNYILTNYEIRKLSKTCNFIGCDKFPSKEILVSVYDSKKVKSKELVSLYLCSKHFEIVEKTLVDELAKLCEEGKIVQKRVFDVGFITH